MVRLGEAFRRRHGIPDAYVPVLLPLAATLPPDALLRQIQDHAVAWSGWQAMEPLWERLITRLAKTEPADPTLEVETHAWVVRLGPVDLDKPIITLQRQGHLIAALAPRSEGGLTAAIFRPLDGRALNFLTGLSVRPDPDGSVAMRPNNWEYALDQSAGMGQAYAAHEGITYLSLWEHGLGVSNDGRQVEEWHAQRTLTPRPPREVAAELRAFVRWPTPPRLRLALVDKPSADGNLVISPASPRVELTVHSRVRGCLLGGAVGDALGAPVEFLSLAEIRQRFGPAGIRDYALAYGRIGAITDDTQMTLFTAEGLLRAWVRGTLKGLCHPPGVIHHAYLRWLLTQRAHPRNPSVEIGKDGWLFSLEALHEQRAPGNTCLSALRDSQSFGAPAVARNSSKGCGGVMRVAPVGLFAPGTDGDDGVFGLAADAAALTHGDPSGYLAAGYLAVAVAALLRGIPLPGALDAAEAQLRLRDGHREVAEAVAAARALAAQGRPVPEQIEALGGGWVAEEALAIAVCCASVARDFEDGVILAANHSGDSDSTAAITGNLLGALLGEDAVLPHWLERLELREEISRLADDLHAAASGGLDAEAAWDRYPGW